MRCEVNHKFPNYRRIADREEFKSLFRYKPLINQWFVVYIRRNEVNVSRLGIIISKKTEPKAAFRNYVKRLIREEFRLTFPTDCALNIIVRARRPLIKVNADSGRQALVQLMREAQKICGNYL